MSEQRVIYRVNAKESLPQKTDGSKGLIVVPMSTGLGEEDVLFGLRVLPFHFTDELQITGVGEEVFMLEETELSEEACKFNNITEEEVAGKSFDVSKLEELLDGCEVIVSHNAGFLAQKVKDRFGDMFRDIPFACTMSDIDWPRYTFRSLSLDYIMYKNGKFFEIEEEAEAILQLLLVENMFEKLLARLFVPSSRIILSRTNFSDKELIKKYNFQWSPSDKTWVLNNVTNAEEILTNLENDSVYCDVVIKDVSPAEKHKQ